MKPSTYVATAKSDSITQQGVELGKFDGAVVFLLIFDFCCVCCCQYEHLHQLGLSILLATICSLGQSLP